jgi:sugar (pentulose or hexulose) kinase
MKHKLGHLARAVMEGTALALGKDIQYFRSMGVPLNKVFCVGGATRNRLLYQMKADIMQLPMVLTDEPESSLKGCAILARYGLGDFKEKQLMTFKVSRNQQVISPNLDVAVRYHDLLQEFIRFYDHLLGFWA